MTDDFVCFPYEFTLLSNLGETIKPVQVVCFPYEFTLLSNFSPCWYVCFVVCFPYEFTLLSNFLSDNRCRMMVCFPYEFTLLSNYNRRILPDTQVCFPYEFTLLSNSGVILPHHRKFVSPTNLHCSQTHTKRRNNANGLFPLRIYTALKPQTSNCPRKISAKYLCNIPSFFRKHFYFNIKYIDLHPL